MKVVASIGAATLVLWLIVTLWGVATTYLNRLMGMPAGGDVEAPFVVLIGGGALAIALIMLTVGANAAGLVARLWLSGGVVLAGCAEFQFASYLDRLKRFVSQEYDSLSGPRPRQLVTDDVYHSVAQWVIGGHAVAAALLVVAFFFFARRMAARQAAP